MCSIGCSRRIALSERIKIYCEIISGVLEPHHASRHGRQFWRRGQWVYDVTPLPPSRFTSGAKVGSLVTSTAATARLEPLPSLTSQFRDVIEVTRRLTNFLCAAMLRFHMSMRLARACRRYVWFPTTAATRRRMAMSVVSSAGKKLSTRKPCNVIS